MNTGQPFAREGRLAVTLLRRDSLCADTFALHLQGEGLPEWTPGAHVEIAVPGIGMRAYSLTGGSASHYEIAVRREATGRGGSRFLCDDLMPGDRLEISSPRNTFPLIPAAKHVFVAGGIGITPFLPMIRKLAADDQSWVLHYIAKDRDGIAFADELLSLAGTRGKLVFHLSALDGRPDLEAILEDDVRGGAALYTCGPQALMDAVECRFAGRPDIAFRSERFGRLSVDRVKAEASPAIADEADEAIGPNDAFVVELAKSGVSVPVLPGESILECVRRVRQGLTFSCSDGYCGTCETAVLGGIPDHRDTVLSDGEKREGRTMMICVGRSLTRTLRLDL